jgi:hypothetical protein
MGSLGQKLAARPLHGVKSFDLPRSLSFATPELVDSKVMQ